MALSREDTNTAIRYRYDFNPHKRIARKAGILIYYIPNDASKAS